MASGAGAAPDVAQVNGRNLRYLGDLTEYHGRTGLAERIAGSTV